MLELLIGLLVFVIAIPVVAFIIALAIIIIGTAVMTTKKGALK